MSEEKEELDSGIMVLNIAGGESIEVDIYRAKLAIEDFEAKQKPYEKGWTTSSESVANLLECLKKAGLENISGAIAMEIWDRINEHWEVLKKNWNFMRTSPTPMESAPSDSIEAS